MSDVRVREYDDDFYNLRKVESLKEGARLVAGRLAGLVSIQSVLDVGCGRGHWLAAFKDVGASHLVGIDGPWNEGKSLVCDGMMFRAQDLELGVSVAEKFDLAICLEAIEHISREAGDKLIEILCQASDLILFSAAIVGQPGIHHVNCQYQSYWVERFKWHAFVCVDFLRPEFWGDRRVAPHYQQNLLVFARSGSDALRRVVEMHENRVVKEARTVDIVHPFVYEIQLKKVSRTREAIKEGEREAARRQARARLSKVWIEPVARRSSEVDVTETAFVSANVDAYDKLKDLSETLDMLRAAGVSSHYFTNSPAEVDQALRYGWDYVYILEKQLARLDARLRAKFFKIKPHCVSALDQCRRFFWMDSSLEIQRPKHLLDFVAEVTGCDDERFVLIPHSRKELAEEFGFIIDNKDDSAYLQKVNESEPIREQLEWFKSRDVDLTVPLFIGSLFGRTLCPRLNELCDYWWDLNLMHSSRDQLTLPVALNEFGIRPVSFKLEFGKGVVRRPHQGFKK